VVARLTRRKRVPFAEDLGSGALAATDKLAAVEHEPTPAEVLRRGVGLVTFSGDKLLGGAQAGILAGNARWIAAIKRDPLFRALRCDKLILSALQATVDLYLAGDAPRAVPVLQLMALTKEELTARAQRMIAGLAGLPLQASIGAGKAQIGGGALPRSLIPSITLDISPTVCPVLEFAARLRRASPPVIGCIAAGRFKLDLRTVFPRQDEQLLQALRSAT
jgi:L-seryl-tRNA(Ser) seleniumtransferase